MQLLMIWYYIWDLFHLLPITMFSALNKYFHQTAFWKRACFLSVLQPAVHLAGPQCTSHDSMPSESVHQGDEWRRAAPAVLLPGEGSSFLCRWAPICCQRWKYRQKKMQRYYKIRLACINVLLMSKGLDRVRSTLYIGSGTEILKILHFFIPHCKSWLQTGRGGLIRIKKESDGRSEKHQ